MSLNLRVRNVGGIYRGAATLEPGVNVVQASNWQGKSSLIGAIEAVMGTDATVTEGESDGRVILSGEERFEVELRRNGEDVAIDGTPFLTDEYDRVCAELFAFLDDTNPVRRTVRERGNLEAVLTRPLDFEAIDERIAEAKAERDAVDRELERSREDARELPARRRRAEAVEAAIEELESRRARLLEELGPDGQPDELSELKAEREQVSDLIQRLERTIDRTSEKLAERYTELDDLTVPEAGALGDQLAEVAEEVRATERDIDLLSSLYSIHRRLLEEDRVELLSEVDHGLLDDEVTCWVCGSATGRAEIRRRLDALGDRVTTLEAELENARERRDELERRRNEVDEARSRKRDLEDEIADLESTLADRQESLESAHGRAVEIEDRIDTLEDADTAGTDELTDVESELKYKRNELAELRDEIERRTAAAERVEHLESEREELQAEIERLRNRKSTVKRETRAAFDRALSGAVTLFDTGFESARLSADFELVVARDGREVGWDALSQGEKELLGFVAALAGHEVYDVGESVPFLLLDRLGGLDDENLHRLVSYLEERAEYLVLTAYPENAAFDGTTIDPTSWCVVSADREAGTV